MLRIAEMIHVGGDRTSRAPWLSTHLTPVRLARSAFPFDRHASLTTAQLLTWGARPRARDVQGRSLPRSQARLCSSASLSGAYGSL